MPDNPTVTLLHAPAEPPIGKRHPITSIESQAYIDTGEWPDADGEDGPWQLRGLTALDVAILDAAMQVAYADSAVNPPVDAAYAKLQKVIDAIIATDGQLPPAPFPIDLAEADDDAGECAVCGDPFGDGVESSPSSVDPAVCHYCYVNGYGEEE